MCFNIVFFVGQQQYWLFPLDCPAIGMAAWHPGCVSTWRGNDDKSTVFESLNFLVPMFKPYTYIIIYMCEKCC